MTSTTPVKLQTYEKDATKVIYSINRLWDKTYIGSAPNGYITVDNTQQIPGLGGITVYERNQWRTNPAAAGGENLVSFCANPYFGDCTVHANYLVCFTANPDSVPAGTAAPISGFEFTVNTAQTAADVGTEDVHGFGCSIAGSGTASICGSDFSVTANGNATACGGSRTGLFVNNASAVPNSFGYQAGSYGTQSGQWAFDVVGPWVGAMNCNGLPVAFCGGISFAYYSGGGVPRDYSIDSSGTDALRIIGGGSPGGIIFNARNATTQNGTFTFQNNPTDLTPYFTVNSTGISSSGVILSGSASPASTTDVFGRTPWIQVSTLNATRAAAQYALYSSNANAASLSFLKSRGSSIGSNVAVQSGDGLAYITFTGYDATGTPVLQEGANIQAFCDAAPTAGSVPGRLGFFTAASGAAPTEAQRIDSTGAVFFPRIGTTASAANAFINNASSPANSLLRSTSSRRYKKKIKPISDKRLANADKFQPVEYSSRAIADDKDARFVGLVAEDVAEIDPALVSYDAEGRPDGVMYDRVLLLQVTALMQRVRDLEKRLERTS